ncbi:MAG: hypothetical protein HYT12_04290 [Candidatus Liptonbacteria bacterium]|nr:hypothetical protein [Candidatus Liptonbacteria bacterium]
MIAWRKFAVLACLVSSALFLGAALKVLAVAETVTTTVGISVQIGDVSPAPSPTPSPGQGSGDEVIIPLRDEATIVMEGFTSPNSFLSFLRNGSIMGTGLSDNGGKFVKTIKTESGNAVFAVWARDSSFLISQTSNFSLTLPGRATTTVKDIFISPTIKLLNTASYRGIPQRFAGSSFPGADIYFIVDDEQNGLIKTDSNGNWEHVLLTKSLNEGLYKIKVRGRLPDRGLLSPLSEEISINLQKMPKRGDCNADGKVSVTDLSIILFYWHRQNPENSCSDLNFDATVDIADISILMYLWTG